MRPVRISRTSWTLINNDADTKDLFGATAKGTRPSPGQRPRRPRARHAGRRQITLTAVTAGADYNQVRVSVVEGTTTTNSAAYDAAAGTLTLTIGNGAGKPRPPWPRRSNTALGPAIFTSAASTGTRVRDTSTPSKEKTQQNTTTGNTGGNLLKGDLVLSVGGATGREVFNFQKDASVNQVVSAINLVSDATGVVASHGRLVR